MVVAALFYLAQQSGIWLLRAITAMTELAVCWYFHTK
jgi:hypothetical protein